MLTSICLFCQYKIKHMKSFFIGNIEDGVQYSFERATDKAKETVGIVCIDDPEDSIMVTEALGILAKMGI